MSSIAPEEWRPVPAVLAGGCDQFTASSQGRILFHSDEMIEPMRISSNQGVFYKAFQYRGTTYYFHRFVYGAFHPDEIDKIVIGTVRINIALGSEIIDDQGFYRSHLSDLVLDSNPYNLALGKIQIEQPTEIKHPKYGSLVLNTPLPVIAHITDRATREELLISYDNYRIIFLDNAEFPCKIINVTRNTHICPNGNSDKSICLSKDKHPRTFKLVHVMLASAFPDIQPEYTVDHIDNNHLNDHITNLQWMKLSENSYKGNEKSRKVPRHGKATILSRPHDANYEPILFISSEAAAKFAAQELFETTGRKVSDKKFAGYFKDIRKGARKIIHGYFVDEIVPPVIEKEEWKRVPFGNTETKISDFGRIMNHYGGITEGCLNRSKKYRSTTVRDTSTGAPIDKHEYVHRLVWQAFVGPIPEGMDVKHVVVEVVNGGFLNYLKYLDVGDRSSNMFEHFEDRLEKLTQNQNTVDIKKTVVTDAPSQIPNPAAALSVASSTTDTHVSPIEGEELFAPKTQKCKLKFKIV